MKKAKAKGNAKAKVTYAPFEVADYLDSEEAIAEYLSLAARDENPGVLLKALGDVAKARGMAEVAKASRKCVSTMVRDSASISCVTVPPSMCCFAVATSPASAATLPGQSAWRGN